jgi:hypothetical protein
MFKAMVYALYTSEQIQSTIKVLPLQAERAQVPWIRNGTVGQAV